MGRPAGAGRLAGGALLLVLSGCAGTVAPDREADESAVVRVQCVLQAGGGLSDCRVLSERPGGMGFGEAALRAAERSRVSPDAGARPGAKVEWNYRFRLDQPAALDPAPPRA